MTAMYRVYRANGWWWVDRHGLIPKSFRTKVGAIEYRAGLIAHWNDFYGTNDV